MNINNRILAVVPKIRAISPKVRYFVPKVWHIRNGIILPKLLIIIFVDFKKFFKFFYLYVLVAWSSCCCTWAFTGCCVCM